MKRKDELIRAGFFSLRFAGCHGGPLLCAVLLLAFTAPIGLLADQVEMQNGDRYVGRVLSLNGDTLQLQNDVLGILRLPRSKVALISFGPVPVMPRPVAPPNGGVQSKALGATNIPPEVAAQFRELAAHTNLIHQIQSQFLSDAGPEANKKFEELLNGLMTGKLNMGDLRAQAQSAADQLRALNRESGESSGFASEAYLSILDQFLKSTPPSGTNGAPKALNVPAEDK